MNTFVIIGLVLSIVFAILLLFQYCKERRKMSYDLDRIRAELGTNDCPFVKVIIVDKHELFSTGEFDGDKIRDQEKVDVDGGGGGTNHLQEIRPIFHDGFTFRAYFKCIPNLCK